MNSNPNQSPAGSKRKLSKKTIIIVGIATLLVLAAGAYVWAQTAQRNNDKDVAVDITDAEGADQAGEVTAKLPNGKTITYENTTANKNISWSSSAKGSDYVDLSHGAVGKHLAAADQAMVTKLCGANGELATKDGAVATISTKARMVEYPTDQSCLEAMATLRNTDPTSRKEAAELAEQVHADIKQFYATVTIK